MFGFRRRGIVSVHAGMTVEELWQRFAGAGWELVNAELTSVEETVERRVNWAVDRFERACHQLRRTSS